MTARYGEPSFWNDRYACAEDEGFDCTSRGGARRSARRAVSRGIHAHRAAYRAERRVRRAESALSLAAARAGLFSLDDLLPTLEPLIAKDDRLLIVGCGNAPFSPDLYAAGYTDLVNFDRSKIVIERQRRLHPHMRWEVMNAMAMKYDDESFDCVIDKSVIDTMLCSADGPRCARAMIGEIQRVLKPRGRYVCISLHPLRDVTSHCEDVGGEAWAIRSGQLLNPRHDESNNLHRSLTHSLVVCDKGAVASELPPLVGTLSDDEIARLATQLDALCSRPSPEEADRIARNKKAMHDCTIDELSAALDLALRAHEVEDDDDHDEREEEPRPRAPSDVDDGFIRVCDDE